MDTTRTLRLTETEVEWLREVLYNEVDIAQLANEYEYTKEILEFIADKLD